jgi:hypothetical protein
MEDIVPGTRLRLRDDAFAHVKTREWIFSRIEDDNKILLMHENGLYGLVVSFDDIDWNGILPHFTPKLNVCPGKKGNDCARK